MIGYMIQIKYHNYNQNDYYYRTRVNMILVITNKKPRHPCRGFAPNPKRLTKFFFQIDNFILCGKISHGVRQAV